MVSVEWEWITWLREGSKRDSSTSQTDAFAGAKAEETIGVLRTE
jgi:hypothetical protein